MIDESCCKIIIPVFKIFVATLKWITGQINLSFKEKIMFLTSISEDKGYRLTFLCLLFIFSWYILSLPIVTQFCAHIRTKAILEEAEHELERYISANELVPANIETLRKWSASQNRNISVYDAFSEKIELIALSRHQWILRSFGSLDGAAKLNTAPNQIRTNLTNEVRNIPFLRTVKQNHLSLYPAGLLMGSSPFENGPVAKIFLDYQYKKRKLVISSIKTSQFYMIANHPMVEEFFWKPNGKEIVFSAVGDDKYNDGIYRWNLEENKIENLTRNLWGGQSQKLVIALSSQTLEEDFWKITAFVAKRKEGSLSPNDFFSGKHFIEISIPSQLYQPVAINRPAQPTQRLFENYQYPGQFIDNKEKTDPAQYHWFQLPNHGPLEEVIGEWQKFSIEYPDSPMFAYSLWWLASIYSDGWHLLKKVNPSEGRTLRYFGMELATALSRMSIAPQYLKQTSIYLKESLSQKFDIGYRVTEVTLPPPPPTIDKDKPYNKTK